MPGFFKRLAFVLFVRQPALLLIVIGVLWGNLFIWLGRGLLKGVSGIAAFADRLSPMRQQGNGGY